MRRIGLRAVAFAFCIAAVGPASALALAPTIASTSVSKVSTNSATLQAEVNPQGKKATYHFEYGLQDCEVGPCASVPAEGKIAANTSPVPVSFPVEGLTLGTTYHLRVVASNADGEVKGPDHPFTTYHLPLSGLPDGRAYEQASPVNKNAADARGLVAWVKAADDGNAVSYLSTSGIPGAEGGQEFPSYLSSRANSSWSTQGLLPKQSAGNEALIRGWLPDFSSVFDFAGNFAIGGGFLSRSSADGSLSQIVPSGEGLNHDHLPSYVGASADGSEVFFESNVKLACCANAIAGKSNVYLWDRASGQVKLVSVLNDEKSPPSGAFAGPYAWMQTPELPLTANAGGAASGYYTQDTHAVSANAQSLYFTAAGSGALYQRVNPTAAQSPLNGEGKCTNAELACTLQVSATHRGAPDPLGSRPAAFMAATPDGATTFFASPEELTDKANTGPEQPQPAIERATTAGTLVEPKFPIKGSGIAIDGEYIYWANPSQDAIARAKLDGSEPKPTFIEIPPLKVIKEENEVPKEVLVSPKPQYVAVDAGHIYWTNEGEGEPKEGTIGRADLEGTPASIEAEWIKGATRPKGIAVNSEFVYWANAGLGTTDEGTIGRAEKSDPGGADEEFIPGVGTRSPQAVALDASHLYWDVEGGDFVMRSELDGSNSVIKFIGGQVQPRGVAVDAGHVYWVSQDEEAIGRMALSGFDEPGLCEAIPSCEPQFIPTDGKGIGLAANATNLYWSVNGEVTPNPGNDLYRYQAADQSLEDVTVDPTPSDVNGTEVKGVLGASEDTKRIYFAANGVLAAGGKAGDCEGQLSTIDSSFSFSGHCNLYLAEETAPGHWSTSFIAPLNASGGGESSDATNWLGKGGGTKRSQRTARTSADGSTLVFRSQEKLTPYDNEGQPELYRYQVGGGISCISCNPTGQAPNGPVGLGSIGLSALSPQEDPAYVLSRNVSADGKRVFFESVDPLVANDTNGEDGCELEGAALFRFPTCQDVYEWEAQGTGTCKEDVQGGGCLYLLSTGTSPNASFFGDASLSGDDAFIATRSAGLVRQDQDQLQDVYDARVGGGLASQNEVPAPECEGLDACHGPQGTPPASQSPATANQSGAGNKKHVRPKKKKHKQKKHKKQSPKKSHKGKRAAHKTGRTSR